MRHVELACLQERHSVRAGRCLEQEDPTASRDDIVDITVAARPVKFSQEPSLAVSPT
ncbi:hypothetical protein RGR602_PC00480 (plasmid) [Rhizobium gallicum bv. gallicum R602sp]|uniref:Uncharacterized protein n=1 Tax=Rhizobium gallicum bv. gallicum R602sp TaxID=1041138 RepID=A0A0B4XCN7_9HYPH|nr:hypothetical protein RGR602_PC00480 [Rhizobium gallicum bv. gallicum R602sp]